MKEIKDSKIRIRKNHKKKDKYDTLDITMELEKSLNIDIEKEIEDKKIREKIKRKIIKNVAIIIIIVIIASLVGFFIWLNDTYKTTEYASHYMISTSRVEVKKDNSNIEFIPRKNANGIGIILYPNQKTKPMSYSRLSSMLAKDGYNVYVPKLKFNFSPFSKNLATDIINQNPSIRQWYLIGHSSSGDIALEKAANEKKINGVIFLGSYPIADDLKLINKPVLSIWGTKDGLLDLSKFSEYKSNMPQNAHYYEIIGGNNGNFADIITIPGDNKSIITAEEQQAQTVNRINQFIGSLSK